MPTLVVVVCATTLFCCSFVILSLSLVTYYNKYGMHYFFPLKIRARSNHAIPTSVWFEFNTLVVYFPNGKGKMWLSPWRKYHVRAYRIV